MSLVDVLAAWLTGPRAEARRARVVAAVLFVTFAWFAQGGGPNQYSRFDLTRAIVDQHTLAIDHYAHNTFDKSSANGHFYSDKAPGLAIAATPAYAVFRLAHAFRTPTRQEGLSALWFITALVVGGTTAVGGAALLRLMRRLGVSAAASTVVVFAWATGTNTFAYATIFMAHAFVAALLVLALDRLRRAHDEQRAEPRAIALAGLLAAWGSISEYPAGVLGLLLFGYGVWRLGLRAMVPFVAGSAAPLLLLAVYNWRCFGAPWSLGYQHLDSPEFQGVIQRGFFGISLPSLTVMGELLFGEFRGLLPLAPWLVLAAPGFVLLFRRRELRPEALLLAAATGSFFLLCASYARWDGGAALGPRYFVPVLGLLGIAAGFTLDALVRLPRPWRAAILALTGCAIAYSTAICSMAVTVMPELADGRMAPLAEGMREPDFTHPLTTFVIPLFLRGLVSVKASFPDGRIGYAPLNAGHELDAFNVGERLGLQGPASIAPLVILWGLTALLLLAPRLRRLDADG